MLSQAHYPVVRYLGSSYPKGLQLVQTVQRLLQIRVGRRAQCDDGRRRPPYMTVRPCAIERFDEPSEAFCRTIFLCEKQAPIKVANLRRDQCRGCLKQVTHVPGNLNT